VAHVKAGNNERWQNAIDTAWDWLLQQDAVEFDHAAHALRFPIATEAGTVYEANGDCQCRAFAQHTACWHRAAARLVRRALEIAPEPSLHPDPAMDIATFAAVWDARSQALGLVAQALQSAEPVPPTTWIASAHVSLTQRLELRRGQHGLIVIEIHETSQGYVSAFRSAFDSEHEARTWMSAEAARLAGATQARTA